MAHVNQVLDDLQKGSFHPGRCGMLPTKVWNEARVQGVDLILYAMHDNAVPHERPLKASVWLGVISDTHYCGRVALHVRASAFKGMQAVR